MLLEVRRASSGDLIEEQQVKNLVPTAGRNLVRDFILNTGYAPNSIAVGTGTTATSPSAIALDVEVFRAYFTRRISADGKATFQLFLTTSDANGFTLTEAGIFSGGAFNGATLISGGTLFARTTFNAIPKDNTITLTITWDIPIAAAV